jgi:cytochrome b pre-mRNA-processing protein 3
MLRRFRRVNPATGPARALYAAIVARAREPLFYARFGVPDTLDGRFDLLTLHAFLVMEGLKATGKEGESIATVLATIIFAGFEDALRDLGVGDLGIGRRIKAIADAFYGRLEACGAAGDETALDRVVRRNLYRGAAERGREAAALAHYIGETLARVTAPECSRDLLAGSVAFGPLPEFEP